MHSLVQLCYKMVYRIFLYTYINCFLNFFSDKVKLQTKVKYKSKITNNVLKCNQRCIFYIRYKIWYYYVMLCICSIILLLAKMLSIMQCMLWMCIFSVDTPYRGGYYKIEVVIYQIQNISSMHLSIFQGPVGMCGFSWITVKSNRNNVWDFSILFHIQFGWTLKSKKVLFKYIFKMNN